VQEYENQRGGVLMQHDISQSWRFGIAAFAGVVVAGALYLIATRGDLMALDLGPHVAGWLWCF